MKSYVILCSRNLLIGDLRSMERRIAQIGRAQVVVSLAVMTLCTTVHAQTDVWVDLTYPGAELGTAIEPFETLTDALGAVASGGTIHLGPGDSHETPIMNQNVRLVASGGTARFGVLSSPLGSGAPLKWLRFTEIMYHPAIGGAEYLELQNTGPESLDISGVYFSDGIIFTFPPSTTINAGERFVLVRDTDLTAFGVLYVVSI